MEMSGFSETQLQVREAVGKICEDFPDVGCLVSFASLSWVSLRICAFFRFFWGVLLMFTIGRPAVVETGRS
jgi:hypothetical protein